MESKLLAGWNSGFFVMVAVLVVASLVSAVQAQDTSCLNQLVPCLNYLQSQDGSEDSDPPKSCCDPLKSVIDSNPQCLCTMISNKGSNAAEQAGINVTEAQELPGKCGQSVNIFSCLANSPSPTTARAESNSASDFSFMGVVMVASILSVSLISDFIGIKQLLSLSIHDI